MSKTMTLQPRLSEKAYGLSQTKQTYVFSVPGNASKPAIAGAVGEQFGVTVSNVNIAVVKGKTKRTVKKGGRPGVGRRSNFKKAYVTLISGDSIPIFAAEEKAEKAAKSAKDKK